MSLQGGKAPAQQAADSGNQNRQIERLGEIVIRSGGEAAQNVAGMAPGRKHEGWNELSGAPHFGHHAEAILARQHHVQHDYIECRRI